ncbi:MAG: hypothetical protein Q8K75_02805 [Chlamydiales bacterium]|nr:hypothetical protein [Chlamydiales bacterium]
MSLGPIIHTQFKSLAEAATKVRDQAYDFALETKLGPMVKRINEFLDDNACLIFWGGALLFIVTQPTFFLAGLAVGIAVSSLVPPGAEEIDVSALRQMVKSVIYVSSPWLSVTTQSFLSGGTPGYHLYRVFCTEYYPGYKHYAGLGQELRVMGQELNQWIPANFRFA